MLAVVLVANRDAIAEKFVGALPFAAKLAVGNFLGVPFEDADPRELLLEEVNDGCLLESLGGDLVLVLRCLALGTCSSPYAPVPPKHAVSGSSLSISTSNGTPAGFR